MSSDTLAQIRAAREQHLPVGVVLADAGYGNDVAFRDGLSALELTYCVGVQSNTTVWALGNLPLPAAPRKATGRPPTLLRRDPEHSPVSVKALAQSLPNHHWQDVAWREGSNVLLSSRFATVRVHAAHRDNWKSSLRPQEWLLIEWPAGDTEPAKYWLASLPAETDLTHLVSVAKMRWRIERDYQELKQEFGLGDFEGRGWRGFHHHATLCIAAYGFLMAHRLAHGGACRPFRPKIPALPKTYRARGRWPLSAACHGLHSDIAPLDRLRHRSAPASLSVLWPTG